MIDWGRLNTLRDEVGEEDFEEVVDLFLDEVESVIDRLTTSQATGQLEVDLHFLKGSAMSLGFRGFANLCQDGETLSGQGKSAEVAVQPIVDCYHHSKALLLSDLPKVLVS